MYDKIDKLQKKVDELEKNKYGKTPYACNKICPTGAMKITRC